MAKVNLPTQNILGLDVYPCKSCLRISTLEHKKNPKNEIIYAYPKTVDLSGMIYAQCSNPDCCAYHQHEFIGMTRKGALNNWNNTMQPPVEGSNNNDF